MQSDSKTLLNALGMIIGGTVLFEFGRIWWLLGEWDSGKVVPLGLGAFGYYIGYVTGLFVPVFVAAVIFIAKPSRLMARKSLVIAAAIAAGFVFTEGVFSLAPKFDLSDLPYAPISMLLASGVFIAFQGLYGAFRGFPSEDADVSAPKDGA